MSRIFFVVMMSFVLCSRESSAHGHNVNELADTSNSDMLFYDKGEEKDPRYKDTSESSDDSSYLDVDEESDVNEGMSIKVDGRSGGGGTNSRRDVKGSNDVSGRDVEMEDTYRRGPVEDVADDEEQHNKFWKHRRPAQPVIELGDHEGENSHLPGIFTVEDHYKNAFYCAGTNDVTGLVAVLNVLTGMGAEKRFVLEELRTKEGDNLLLYAVKGDALDTTRYLLSAGSDVNAVDEKGNTPLQIAVSGGRSDMINAILEMQVGMSDPKDDDEDDEDYDLESVSK